MQHCRWGLESSGSWKRSYKDGLSVTLPGVTLPDLSWSLTIRKQNTTATRRTALNDSNRKQQIPFHASKMVKLTFLLAAATALTSVMAGSDASEVTKSLDIATPSDLATAPTGNLASEQAEDYIFEWEDDEEDLDEDDLDDDTSLLGEESGLLLKRQTGLACNTPGAKAPVRTHSA